MVHRPRAMMALFVVLIAGTLWAFLSLPTGFLPVEDQGYVIAGVQLPDAASQTRMTEVLERMNTIIAKTPGVANWNSIGGYSVIDGTVQSNSAAFYIVFQPWETRTDPTQSQNGI